MEEMKHCLMCYEMSYGLLITMPSTEKLLFPVCSERCFRCYYTLSSKRSGLNEVFIGISDD